MTNVLKRHKWRLTQAQRFYNKQATNAPLLKTRAARILRNVTRMTDSHMARVLNCEDTFYAPFRPVVQNTETLLDCGYRVYVVPRDIPTQEKG